MKSPILYLISTPIGNPLDISSRALEILQNCDLIIGEEFKETSKLLKRNSIDKEFELLNEHSTPEELGEIFEKLKKSNISCQFSDGGTPILEDPGLNLVQKCISSGITVKAIPGPSALMTALVLSGIKISPFTFIGFLPRESIERIKKMKEFQKNKHTLVLYETPYRYKKAFRELKSLFKPGTKVFFGLNLTALDEIQFHGTWIDLLQKIEEFPKGNPVLVIDNS